MSDLQRTRIIVGTSFGVVTAIEESELQGLIALRSSTTWGEFRKRAPRYFVEQVYQRLPLGTDGVRRVRLPKHSDELDVSLLEGVADGDWPFPEQDMLLWLPDEVLRRFPETCETTLNGEMAAIDPEHVDAFIAALEEAGFECVRDDKAIGQARG